MTTCDETTRTDRAAIALLIRAASAGAGEAAAELGDRYREGNGIAADYGLALHWYGVGARLGDPEAQNNYGSMLLNGAGCGADEAAAAQWFRASAEQGNAVAQYNLGIRYLHGSGVDADDPQAFEWLSKSAIQGYVEAIGELGTLFRFGRGATRDLLAAAELHIAAAEQGDPTSQGNLADYHEELIAMALDRNREAAFDLMRMFQSGLGVDKDPALCWAWIRHAHKLRRTEKAADELDATIEDAYRFFRSVIGEAVRKSGEARLHEMMRRKSKAVGHAKKKAVKRGAKQ